MSPRVGTMVRCATLLALFGVCVGQFPQYGSQGSRNNPQYGDTQQLGGSQPGEQFRVVYEWARLDYAWPDDPRKADAARADFVPENNVLWGVRVWRDRLFMSVPRWKRGVPATLTTLPAASNGGPQLQPFPSWAMQQLANCSALQNVRGLEVDADGRLWVADSGRVDVLSPGDNSAACPPKLVIFDVRDVSGAAYDTRASPTPQGGTNYNYGYSSYNSNHQNHHGHQLANFSSNMLLSFTFPEQVIARDSVLMELVVDATGGGYAYISDASPSDPGIIVFSRNENRAWKVRDASMRADPQVRSVQFDGGQYLSLQYGNVDGLALSPATPNPAEERMLYYSPLASYNMYSVPTTALKEASSGRGDVSHAVRNLGRKASISDGMTMDNRGNLYYGLLTEYEIARWDTRQPFQGNQHNISKDRNHLQWPASFGFDDKGSLFVVANKFQNFLMNRVNTDEPNNRIIRANFYNVKSYLYPAENVGSQPDYDHGNPNYNRNNQNYPNQPRNYTPNNPNYTPSNPNYNSNNPNNPNYNPNNPSYNPNNPNYNPNNPNYNQNNPNYNPNNDPNDPYGRTSTTWPTTDYNQGHTSQYGGNGAAFLCTPYIMLLSCLAAVLSQSS